MKRFIGITIHSTMSLATNKNHDIKYLMDDELNE